MRLPNPVTDDQLRRWLSWVAIAMSWAIYLPLGAKYLAYVLTGRGLNLARREAGRWAPQLLAGMITLQTRVDREAEERFIRPHISRLSMIEGVRAGVIAFWRGRPTQV